MDTRGADLSDLEEMQTADMSRLLAVTREDSEEEEASTSAVVPPALPSVERAAAATGTGGTDRVHASSAGDSTQAHGQSPSAAAVAAAAALLGDDATASFVAEVLTLVDEGDINALKQLQHRTLANMQDSTEMLSNFNRFSAASYPSVAPAYMRSTRLVQNITADLHYIFKRTRALQARIRDAYPHAWAAVGERPRFGDDD